MSSSNSTKPTDLRQAISRTNPNSQSARDPNWHGRSYQFAKLYQDKLYEDKSMLKATRKKVQEAKEEREKAAVQRKLAEYERFKQKLEDQKTKELEKRSRLKHMLRQHQQLQEKMESAAIVIQKYARGYITRTLMKDLLVHLDKLKLQRNLNTLNFQIKECWINLGTTTRQAAVKIQKVWRGYAVRTLLQTKNQPAQAIIVKKAVLRIQAFFRNLKACRAALETKKQLEARKKRLAELREAIKMRQFTQFWERNKFRWRVIRHHYEIFTVVSENFEELKERNIDGFLSPTNFQEFSARSHSSHVNSRKTSYAPSPLRQITHSSHEEHMRNPETPAIPKHLPTPSPENVSGTFTQEATREINLVNSLLEVPPSPLAQMTRPLPHKVRKSGDEITAWKTENQAKTRAQTAPRCDRPPIAYEQANYLKPTQTYISRTNFDKENAPPMGPRKAKFVRGRRFQQDTKSRVLYKKESQEEKQKRLLPTVSSWRHRTSTRDNRRGSSPRPFTQPKSQPDIRQAPSPFLAQILGLPTPVPQAEPQQELLSKLEETVLEDSQPTERVHVYRPPSAVTYQFKQALPELYQLVETYGKVPRR